MPALFSLGPIRRTRKRKGGTSHHHVAFGYGGIALTTPRRRGGKRTGKSRRRFLRR